jgi:hypothetical protein
MYSQTQLANYTSLAGLLIIVLKQVGITLGMDEAMTVIGGLVVLSGIVWNFVNRYKQGDITIVGKRL